MERKRNIKMKVTAYAVSPTGFCDINSKLIWITGDEEGLFINEIFPEENTEREKVSSLNLSEDSLLLKIINSGKSYKIKTGGLITYSKLEDIYNSINQFTKLVL